MNYRILPKVPDELNLRACSWRDYRYFMEQRQGTMFSPNNIVLYKSLGFLLKDYRKWQKLSQEILSESIGVSVRELRNWEAGRRRAGIENLHDISEVTGIPMQVCLALNADQPIWYSLRKRLFMYSSLEEAQFYSFDLLEYSEKSEDNTLLKKVAITKNKHIDLILSCHKDLYDPKRPLQRDVFKAASFILPDLNYILTDYWNHYIAHEVCLPITLDAYNKLKKQDNIENYLKSEMISDIIAQGEGVFFYYSSFASNISASFWVIMDAMRALSKIKQKERYLLASHTVIKESAIIQNNLGMSLGRDYRHLQNELCPAIYEMGLDFHPKINVPDRWDVEKIAAEGHAMNVARRTKQLWSPANPSNKQKNIIHSFKEHSPNKIDQHAVLTVDKNAVLTVDASSSNSKKRNCQKKLKPQLPKHKIGINVCPNTKCALYAKSDKANIISNGTFRLKDGTNLRRYICKECGKSFCSKTSGIFYGLRSPDEKILNALKLLIKGMSLRGVAKTIGVEFRTVSLWLKVASKQNKKINTILIKEPDVSQDELDAFWAFYEKQLSLAKSKVFE